MCRTVVDFLQILWFQKEIKKVVKSNSAHHLSLTETEQRVQDAPENPQPVPPLAAPEQSTFNLPVMAGEDKTMLQSSSFQLPKSSKQLGLKKLAEQLQAAS
jgi:hypothetical protein